MALTAKQALFVAEYLKDLNATAAYKRAGYRAKGNSAEVNAHNLLRNPKVANHVKVAQQERVAKVGIDAEYVLRRLIEIDRMDVLDIMTDEMNLKPVSEWPPVWRQYLSGFDLSEIFEGAGEQREMIGLLKKIKWPDKVRNLELLGKHVSIQAFKDKIEHSGNISLADALREAREKRKGSK